jgi:hypothetical protein
MSHSEPAVRHAVNALGAMHEERYLRTKAAKDGLDVQAFRTDFPVQQYVKSLNEMQVLLKDKSSSLDTVLLCSLLCAHFECLRETFLPALLHVENAISLLYEQNARFDPRKVNPSLVRAVMRLDLQGTLYLTMRTPGLSFYTAAIDSILPHSFRDLTQARDLINSWTGRLYHFTRTVADGYKFGVSGANGVPLEEYAKAQELERTMIELERLLWDFLHKPTSRLTAREQLGLGMLRSRTIINRVIAATCLHTEASAYDRFLPEFEDVLTICQHIMASDFDHRPAPGGDDHEADDAAARRLLSVSMDEGLIHPLCDIAAACRDSRIRHRALDALRRLPVGEGNWHIESTIRTCEMCIEYEERSSTREFPSCEDIPEWWRVQGLSFDGWETHGPMRKVKAQFRTRPNGTDGGWVIYDVVIDWYVYLVPDFLPGFFVVGRRLWVSVFLLTCVPILLHSTASALRILPLAILMLDSAPWKFRNISPIGGNLGPWTFLALESRSAMSILLVEEVLIQ